MGTSVTRYVMVAVDISDWYKEKRAQAKESDEGWDESPAADMFYDYYDDGYNPVPKDGIVIVHDAMCGKYSFMGYVLYKGVGRKGIEIPAFALEDLDTQELKDRVKCEVRDILGFEGEAKTYVFSHFH